jgi:Flp pilus assembly protein TadG
MVRGFLRSLARDDGGNVLMLTAASVVVFLAMGGGALDASRMYLAKNRLQQACDAGVLAYRRSMKGANYNNDTYNTAKAYFNANYTPGKFGTENPIFPVPSVDSNVVVHGAASVIVPMTLMSMFGFSNVNLQTKCDAQLQLPNTDVMFVLDTTGSMTDINPGDTEAKISVLRKAVKSFYDTLEMAKVAGTQVRYGFVPYSNTVNVGLLLRREWLADFATYQSRKFDRQDVTAGTKVADEITTKDTGWQPDTSTKTTSRGDPENCVAPASTVKTTPTKSDPWDPSDKAQPRTQKSYRTISGDQYSASIDSSGVCNITKTSYPSTDQTREVTIDKNPKAGQNNADTKRTYWWYLPVRYDVSGIKGGSSGWITSGGKARFPVNDPSSTDSSKPQDYEFPWNATTACIEERKTLRPGEAGTAWDMDIDKVPDPSDEETQWKPYIPAVVFARSVTSYGTNPTGWNMAYPINKEGNYQRLSSQTSLYNACPSAARKLQTAEAGLTSGTLDKYLAGLVTKGWTYHDVGFLWGLRLISKEGLFASENKSAPNGSSIGRNIIFMTDGDTDTHYPAYDAYGLSALDRRRTSLSKLPEDSDQNQIVEDRLLKYCSIAKEQKGITVWVIAFGTTLTPLLSDCATPGRAFQADNATQLNATFAEIAAKIAQLRITK